jgi:hypothetical protein
METGYGKKQNCDLCHGNKTVQVIPSWMGLSATVICHRCFRDPTRAALIRIEDAIARIERWQQAVYRLGEKVWP